MNKVAGGKIYPNKMDGISVGIKIYRNFDARFDRQLRHSKLKRQIAVDLIYKSGILTAVDEDGNTVESDIVGEEPQNPEKMREIFIAQLQKTGESDFYIREIKIGEGVPFMPVSQINSLRRALLEKLMAERLSNYKHEEQAPLRHTQYPAETVDYRGNIHNKKAEIFYEQCGAKVKERSYESSPKRKCELMRTKHCLKFAFGMCKTQKELFLIDEKGKKYKLEFDCKNCEMVIKSSE